MCRRKIIVLFKTAPRDGPERKFHMRDSVCECHVSGWLYFYFFCFVLFFVSFVFVFLGLHPQAHGGSQARDQIGAVVASLRQSYSLRQSHSNASNAGFELRLRPTPHLTAMPDP